MTDTYRITHINEDGVTVLYANTSADGVLRINVNLDGATRMIDVEPPKPTPLASSRRDERLLTTGHLIGMITGMVATVFICLPSLPTLQVPWWATPAGLVVAFATRTFMLIHHRRSPHP